MSWYTMISSVDLAHYGVSRAKDWVFVDCGTICSKPIESFQHLTHILCTLCSTPLIQTGGK